MDEVGGGSKQDKINFFMERGRENVPAECIPHLYNAYCAARDVSYPVLFICAFLDEKKKICLHILNWKDSKTPCLVKVANENEKKIKEEIKRVRTTLETELKSNSGDEKIIQTGKSLFEKLVSKKQNGIIINELKKNKWGMWIYCDDVFDPIWEWLYVTSKTSSNSETPDVTIRKTRDKNSSRVSRFFKGGQNWNKLSKSNVEQPQKNSKEEGFFWGDKFSIIRIAENSEFEDSSFQINNVGFLGDENCEAPTAVRDHSCLNTKGVYSSYITSDNPRILNDYDCIYVVATAEAEAEAEANTRHGEIERTIGGQNINKKNFLFLNILTRNSYTVCSLQSKLMRLIPAKTCIYTSLNVSVDFTPKFTDCFFECVCGGKNVAEVATEAREKISTLGDLDSSERFWRFAYVVKGNPCIKITLP